MEKILAEEKEAEEAAARAEEEAAAALKAQEEAASAAEAEAAAKEAEEAAKRQEEAEAAAAKAEAERLAQEEALKKAEEEATAAKAAKEEAERLAAEEAEKQAAEEAARAAEEAAAAETEEEDYSSGYSGTVLTAYAGRIQGPSGEETYYNQDLSDVISRMRSMGFDSDSYPYWVRSDGCKMLGDYIICAANLDVHPRGTTVESSLGTCLVCDTGGFAEYNIYQLDIATTW